MLDSILGKPGSAFASALDRLARASLRAGVTPNGLSCAALGFGVVAALLFYVQAHGVAFVVLLASGLCDAIDGRVARLGGGATVWGGVLDLTFDRVVEAVVLLGVVVPHPEWHLPGLVVACTWYVNLCVFLVVGAASERSGGKLIAYPPGLLERGELLLFALVVVLLPAWAAAAAYLYAGLEIVTGAQRFLYGRKALRGPAPHNG